MLADNLDVVIGKNLRNLRFLRGFTQQKLGEEVGVSFQQIQKYETGRNRISGSTMIALARSLNISVVDLFGELEEKDSGRSSFMDSLDKEVMQLMQLFSLLRSEKTKKAVINLLKNQVENQDKAVGI